MWYQNPFREEFKTRIEKILKQMETRYDEIVQSRRQLDQLRQQNILLRQEFNSFESNVWTNTGSAYGSRIVTMSSLHLSQLQSDLANLEAIIAVKTKAYNRLVQDSYQHVSSLLSTLNDCLKCEG